MSAPHASSAGTGPAPPGPGFAEPIHELRFLVQPAHAPGLIRWAEDRLPASPPTASGAPTSGDIHSLYLDTPALDIFHRGGSGREGRLRLRRIGGGDRIHLEHRCRVKGQVREQSTDIPADELSLLRSGVVPASWPGAWFHQRLRERELLPACAIAYRRFARHGRLGTQDVTFTLDQSMRGRPISELEMPALPEGDGYAIEGCILELRFSHALPLDLKHMVRDFGLVPSTTSKYRLAVAACRLVPGRVGR